MNRKNLISAAFFLLLLTATIVVIFQGNDMNTVVAAMQTLSPVYLVAAALTALFFTSAEGIMIWYLLGSLEGKTPLFSCIKYSFVGFFYSGITPDFLPPRSCSFYKLAYFFARNASSCSCFAAMTSSIPASSSASRNCGSSSSGSPEPLLSAPLYWLITLFRADT